MVKRARRSSQSGSRLRELRALNLKEWHARELASSRKGYWRMSSGPLLSAMPRR